MFADGFRNLWSSTALHIANENALYADWKLPALTYSGSQLTRRSYCTNSLSKVYRLPMLQLPLDRLWLVQLRIAKRNFSHHPALNVQVPFLFHITTPITTEGESTSAHQDQ